MDGNDGILVIELEVIDIALDITNFMVHSLRIGRCIESRLFGLIPPLLVLLPFILIIVLVLVAAIPSFISIPSFIATA